jgi:DNA-binding NarL/FixJ family response regulator
MATIERTDQIRIVLADDHPLILEGIRALIQDAPGMAVVGEATNGDDAVEQVLAAQPDVAVIDIRMPGIDGVEATRRILRARPQTRVIVLSAQADADTAVQALRAGAIGFLPKEAFGTTLLDGIRSAASGEVALTPDLVSSVVRELHAPPAPSGLTDGDRRLLELVRPGAVVPTHYRYEPDYPIPRAYRDDEPLEEQILGFQFPGPDDPDAYVAALADRARPLGVDLLRLRAGSPHTL